MTLPAACYDPEGTQDFIATSAAGSMAKHCPVPVISASGSLLASATSASSEVAALLESRVLTLEQTHSGIRPLCIVSDAAERTSSFGSALLELRRLSGSTWEQLAELFGVSRRSLHFWASGKPQNSSNERRVQQLLATLRQIDRGSARENRAALFAVQPDGVIPFNLLREERYDDVIARLGRRVLSSRPTRRPLSPEVQARRRPPKPDQLVGALHDTVHHEAGKIRRARARRVKSR